MITEEQYNNALQTIKDCEQITQQYHKEKWEAFENRLKDNPIFTDDELHYSRHTLCPCGHGLAYPKNCGPFHYWDCSAILKGIANKNVEHTGRLPFTTYDIKGEREGETTRGIYKPKI
jgi:hypothetical protein